MALLVATAGGDLQLATTTVAFGRSQRSAGRGPFASFPTLV